ncbi:MAG: hypothetical protein HDR51_00345 [Treponema sp.]|nr:hypothetical protein [Treponema sp.]
MGNKSKIYRFSLEEYVNNLRYCKRLTYKDIESTIKKEKNLDIGREAIRNFFARKGTKNTL